MNHPFVANLLRRTGGSMPNKMPESGSGLGKALSALVLGGGACALAYNSAYSGAEPAAIVCCWGASVQIVSSRDIYRELFLVALSMDHVS